MRKLLQTINGRLARRVGLCVILTSTIVTLFTSGFQIYSEYKRDINTVLGSLEQIEKTHLYNITSRVWVLDKEELKITLDSLLSLPSMSYISVYENQDLIMAVGEDRKDNIIKREYPLVYDQGGIKVQLGRLVIKASLDDTYQHIIERALVVFSSNMIKTFIVAFMILLIFYLLVARHLTKLSRYVECMEFDTLNKPFKFDRDKKQGQKQDELDLLWQALETMQTNLIRSSADLKDREQDLAITLNSIGDAVITTDNHGCITRMNPVAEKITGWMLNEAKGVHIKNIFSIIDTSSRKPKTSPIERVMQTGETTYLNNHMTLLSRDGQEYQITDSTAPIRDGDGDIKGAVLVFNNVTEQYLLREASAKHKRDLQSIMDHSPAVIYIKDIEGCYIFINKQFETLFNVKGSEVVGKNDHDIFAKEFADIFRQNDKEVLSVGHALELEEIAPHEDGERIYVSVKFPLMDEQSNTYAVCGISTDITQRKVLENSLRDNAERFNRWKESNFIGILHSKANGDVIDANNTFLSMLGYSQKDLDDGILDWTKLTPAEFSHLDQVAFAETETKGYWTPFEKEYIHKDGHHVPILIGGSVFSKNKDEYIVFIVDLTERKQHEEQYRRTQKMEALGQLTGGVAHDYNNMLAIINGYSELLIDALCDQPKLTGYTNEIIHASDRGATLTKKLLAFSQKQTTHAENININTVLLDEKFMLEKTLTARIQLQFELADDLWPVRLDVSDLEDSIVNLSINAMHAIDGHGHLILRTSNEQLNTLDAKALDLAVGDYVLLGITDTGCGMSAYIKEKIFEPFYTTKGDRGTGLGLSQVYGFIKRSGGVIRVYSEIGHGTRMALYFPRYQPGDLDSRLDDGLPPIAIKGNETILVVDDEPSLLNLTREMLNLHGYHVLCANNASQALDILKMGSIDVLVSDVIMPEMDGYQLAKTVQETFPKVKIQLVSGFSGSEHHDLVNGDLHKNMLNKPFNSKTLLQKIRKLLDDA